MYLHQLLLHHWNAAYKTSINAGNTTKFQTQLKCIIFSQIWFMVVNCGTIHVPSH